MVDTLPVSPQPVVSEQPRVTPPPSATPPVSPPQSVAKVSDTLGSAEYAGFGARFLASSADVAFVVIFNRSLDFLAKTVGLRPETAPYAIVLLMALLEWSLVTYYFVYFIGSRGQTLGKKALKIRVVRAENGEAPGYTKAFLREVVGKMVSAMVFGLGYLWMLWDGKKQTWHDKIAGTVVVKA